MGMHLRELKLLKNNNDYMVWFLALFFIFFVFLTELEVYHLLILGSFLILFLLLGLYKKYIHLSKMKICFLIMLLTMMINLRPESSIGRIYWVYWLIGIGTCFFFDKRKCSSFNFILKVFLIISIYTMLIVFISKFLPSLYNSAISSRMSADLLKYNKDLLKTNYSAAIVGSISETCYYLFAGICAVCCLNVKKMVKIITIVLLFVALIATGRRGEALAAVIALLMLYLYSADSDKKTKRFIKIIIIAIFCVFLLFAFWPVISKISILSRYAKTVMQMQNNTDISSGRFAIYKVAFQKFLENPLFGVGWRCFYKYIPVGDGSLRNAHNVYLQLLAEVGIIGTVLIGFPFVYLFKKTITVLKQYSKIKVDSIYRNVCIFSFTMQIFLFLVAMVDNPLYKSYIGMFYAILIICVIKAEYELNKTKEDALHADINTERNISL